MQYVEMTVEEATKICNKNATVLVAIKDLESDDSNMIFVRKKKSDYSELFEDAKTIASLYDDFIKQLSIFTEKQNIGNILPRGQERIILLRQ